MVQKVAPASAQLLYRPPGRQRRDAQQRLLFDLVFLHRENPAVRPFFEWAEGGSILPDAAREADRPALVAMVAQHEGAESARLAAHWLARQPEGFLVFRDAHQEPIGFMAMIALERATPQDLQADPATRAAWSHLCRYAPLRAGERATYFRFWMSDETYQAVSPVQSLVFIQAVNHSSRLDGGHRPSSPPLLRRYELKTVRPRQTISRLAQTAAVSDDSRSFIAPLAGRRGAQMSTN